jgi:uncharacterized protein (TIGR02145 family)
MSDAKYPASAENILRFCRRSLTALPFFLLFAACDKLLPPAGSGEWVQVKIRAVHIAGGAKNETVTRAGGASRMVGELIIQDLGGGLFAEIAVEEDLPALRATELETDKTFRVIALKSSDKTYLSHADFTVGGDSKPSIYVPDNVQCDFVCYSYNSSDALPEWSNGDLSALLVDNSKDLLWGMEDYTSLSGGRIVTNDTELKFTLSQQLVKVTLKLNAGKGKTITNIAAAAPISLDAPTEGDFDLKEGRFSGSGSFSFSGWTPSELGVEEVTSDLITFLPKATEDYVISWPANAVTATDGSGSKAAAAGSVTILNSKLAAGGSYTIRLKPLRFAGSNIYWDDSDLDPVNHKLTFDEHGSNTNTKYQGVFFKWGSLIGVSPRYDYNSSSGGGTVLYRPTNTDAGVGSPRTWDKTSGSTWGSYWSNIPSYAGENVSSFGEDKHTLLYSPKFGEYKGDICNYIDSGYRMPTLDELEALGTPSSGSTGSVTNTDSSGKHVFASSYSTFAGGYVLPASGSRNYSNGELSNTVGNRGYYWSGSAYSSGSSAYYLEVSGITSKTFNTSRDYGMSVRCVLN